MLTTKESMKRFLVVLLAGLFLGLGSTVQAKDISITAGISFTNFQEVNEKVLDKKAIDPLNLCTITRLDKMSYAYPIELTVMYDLSKNVKLGFKTGYTYVPTAEISITSPIVINLKYTVGMVPVLVGGKYLIQINERTKIGAGLLGGIGLAYYREDFPSAYGADGRGNIVFGGLTFCADATLDIDYEIVKNISLVSSFGYRYARFDNMPKLSSNIEEVPSTIQFLGYNPWASLKNYKDINALDFSGLSLSAGVRFALQ